MIRIARLAMLAAIALGCVTGQGVKLGIVNSQKAMLDTSEIKKAPMTIGSWLT